MKKKETPLVSPVPIKPAEMNFYEALKEAMEGKRITRPEWPKGEYGFVAPDGTLSIHRKLADHHWIVSMGDTLATGWTIF